MRNKEKKQPMTKKEDNSVSTPSLTSALFGGIFQGFSFGTGSSIAHNLFRSNNIPNNSNENKDCSQIYQEYETLCIGIEDNDLFEQRQCKELFENLKISGWEPLYEKENIILNLSMSSKIKLDCKKINATIEDIDIPWPTKLKPLHK